MRRITTLTLAAALAALAVAPAADAHKLERKPARKAATAEAQKIASATDADRFEIKSCKRQNRHTWNCLAAFYYTADAAMCEVPIKVFYKSHDARRIRRQAGDTVCY